MAEKPTSVSRTSSFRQSPKVNRMDTYDENYDDYEDNENRDNGTVYSVPSVKRTHRDTGGEVIEFE